MTRPQDKPKAEPFVMLPRGLLQSDAWRGLGVNSRRLVDFLMLEWMRHGGQENGNLKAPHRQLVEFGVNPRFVASTVCDVETRGLIRVARLGGRAMNTFTLTWLPTPIRDAKGKVLFDGKGKRLDLPATHDWRKFSFAPYKGEAHAPYKGEAQGGVAPYKGEAQSPVSAPYKCKAPSRIDLTRESELDSVSRGGVPLRVVPGGAR